MRRIVLALAAVFATSGFSAAQSNRPVTCGPRLAIINFLAQDYGESLFAVAINGNSVLEIYAVNGGTWTLLLTAPNGVSCIMDHGTDWTPITRKPGLPG